jgi:DNA-binding MarR family transcriptional regulator
MIGQPRREALPNVGSEVDVGDRQGLIAMRSFEGDMRMQVTNGIDGARRGRIASPRSNKDGVKNRIKAKLPAQPDSGQAAPRSINFGPLATWVGFNLRMAQESAFEAFSRRSLEVGESPGRFATLTLIGRNPGISQTELSVAAGRDKSSLTPVVEDLVRRGLIERKRVHDDRRAYRLNLTAFGKKTLTQLTRCARRHERNLDAVIGLRDRKRFIQILKKIAAEIE